MTADGFSIAVNAFIAQNYGARSFDRAGKRVSRRFLAHFRDLHRDVARYLFLRRVDHDTLLF